MLLFVLFLNFFLKYSISDTNNTINKATNANANNTPSIEAGIELPIISIL